MYELALVVLSFCAGALTATMLTVASVAFILEKRNKEI